MIDQKLPAGEHTVQFHAGNLPSGMYLYKLSVERQRSLVRKFLLLK